MFDCDVTWTSKRRRAQVERELTARAKLAEPKGLVDTGVMIWSKSPVRNHESAYFAAMTPSSGELRVWVTTPIDCPTESAA